MNKIHGNIYIYLQPKNLETTKVPNLPWLVPNLDLKVEQLLGKLIQLCHASQTNLTWLQPSGGKWLVILKAGGKWLSWLQQVCSEQIWLPEVQWLWQVRNHHFIRYISGVVFRKSTNLIHPTEQVNPEAVTREDRGFLSYTCDVPVSFRNWKYGTIKTLDSYTLVQTTLITVTNPSTTPDSVWTITLLKHARRI